MLPGMLRAIAWALLFLAAAAPSQAAPGPFHVVVLGSSTAAGTGPSHPDSAWVNRYRANAESLNPSNQVTNLALGGYTTYHILPTGSVPPPGRPAPDPARNITQALSLSPDFVIINLPSNDAASGYAVSEQLANYDSVLVRAAAEGVPVWISTTQPRNLPLAGRTNLMEMRDSTFARFGEHAVDFWNTLALPGGTIDPLYDSGDGIHLNDAGHGVLFERVAAKGIFCETALGALGRAGASPSFLLVRPGFPNPAHRLAAVRYDLGAPAWVVVTLHDAAGRRLRTLENRARSPGSFRLAVDRRDLAAGVYFYRVEAAGRSGAGRVVFSD